MVNFVGLNEPYIETEIYYFELRYFMSKCDNDMFNEYTDQWQRKLDGRCSFRAELTTIYNLFLLYTDFAINF